MSCRLRFIATSALILLALAAPRLVVAQGEAMLAIQAPAQPPVAGATFKTPVTIVNAAGLMGFQVDIGFDPALLAVESVALGPFLKSVGGAQPLGPDLRAASQGQVTFGGYTLAAAKASGVSGDGVLAIITWHALHADESTITLSRPLLAGADGSALPASTSSPVTVTVEAKSRLSWLWAGLAAAGILVGLLWLWRRRYTL
jgi:hypothetical protein